MHSRPRDRISSLSEKERDIAFLMLPGKEKAEVFPYLEMPVQEDLAKSLGNRELAEILNNLDPDDRTALFTDFPDNLIKHCINLLNKEQKEALKKFAETMGESNYEEQKKFFKKFKK